MSKTYNILWIDDEYDHPEMETFMIQAETLGIILHGFSNFKEGFAYLNDNLNHYDAILLDALFLENENSETVNKKGLGASIAKIHELKSKKVFPFFVLSGQPTFTEKENDILEANNLKCYNKKNPEDVKELLHDIKAESDMQTDLQIKHENQLLFEILNEYPNSARDTFIAIFRGLKGFDNHFDDQLYFTQLRIILETLFRKANACGLLHDKCVQVNGNQVNLTESCLFLSGQDTNHLKVTCSVTHFPKLIANNVKNIIHTTGAASHTSVVDITENIHIQAYRRDVNTPYLLYSLALQLMDVLIWFHKYMKSNNNIAINKSYWQDIEYDGNGNKFETAKIVNVAANGWASVLINNSTKSISVYKGDVTNLNLNTGDLIKFTVKDSSQAQNITKL
ncbi:hypothetical protein FHS04_001281 [Mesoflavibacter sabulilitoris]|uniref:Uncharacterized protein n=1 Tax=Mesoflavibacter zeaxanthinifaciens subsp. sabulilitoris TaxID=1520893 RepID=A0A2T1NAD2_9FLAO|nr:hypothetical protein [Mesoflavibacter zeaxanthinifaciens]MBB3123778.1 hypothetical protein [Mesoflavibacter zeaxanthinifaciens subsp. sabulilitoris]PSG89104.1 hypothetical protein C7H61_09095 [Mesoflavibacter zeaxanthinifaciens subsp. sabulilitoris]